MSDASSTNVQNGPDAAEGTLRSLTIALIVLAAAGLMAIGVAAGAYARGALAERDLGFALERASAADATVLEVQSAIEGPPSGRDAAEIRRIEAAIPAARRELVEARRAAARALPGLAGDDARLAAALTASSKARVTELDAGSGLLTLREKAAEAARYAPSAWRLVADASADSDRAAVAFNAHTAAGVRSSLALSRQAESELGRAATLLARAQAAMPEADLRPLSDYAKRRRDLAARSVRIDELWLKRDVLRANALLASYSDDLAAVLRDARGLPADATQPLADAVGRVGAATLARYEAARRAAADADADVAALTHDGTGAQPSP